jgi:hypothetical protein
VLRGCSNAEAGGSPSSQPPPEGFTGRCVDGRKSVQHRGGPGTRLFFREQRVEQSGIWQHTGCSCREIGCRSRIDASFSPTRSNAGRLATKPMRRNSSKQLPARDEGWLSLRRATRVRGDVACVNNNRGFACLGREARVQFRRKTLWFVRGRYPNPVAVTAGLARRSGEARRWRP